MIFLSKIKRIKIKSELLEYISKQENEGIGFVDLMGLWKLSYKQLGSLLGELLNEKEIVTYQKHLRKPILISVNDYENYYWKVFPRSEKHPNSKLGTLIKYEG